MEEKVAAIIAALRKRYPGRALRAALWEGLRADDLGASVGAVHGRARQSGHARAVCALSDARRLCGGGCGGGRGVCSLVRLLPPQGAGHCGGLPDAPRRVRRRVPDTMEQLLRLPGVGRKTANLLLGDLYGKPAVVCDTHCIRIANRLGLAWRQGAGEGRAGSCAPSSRRKKARISATGSSCSAARCARRAVRTATGASCGRIAESSAGNEEFEIRR